MTVVPALRRPLRRATPRPSAIVTDPARRLDWRFILPKLDDQPFDTLRLVCNDAMYAEQILAMGIARRVLIGTEDTEKVDAAVVIGGRPAELTRAVASLRAGGVLYCEIDRSRIGAVASSPARLRRQLRRAGLVTATYWRRRRGRRDSLFLPLDVPGAVAWYLRELLDDRDALRRFGRTALLALVRQDGRRLGAIARHYSVTGVREVRGDGMPRLRTATPGMLAGDRAEALLPVVLAHGEGPWSRVVLLPFGARDREPRLVVKLPRTAEHNAATEREQEVLRQIARLVPDDLAPTIPAAMGVRSWSDLSVGAESFVPGRPLSFVPPLDTKQPTSDSHLTGAVDWLIEMHVGTRQDDVPARSPAAEQMLDELMLQTVRTLRLPLVVDLDSVCARYGAARAGGSLIPVVWQHCDLTPRNIRWDGRRYSVVDWEVARVGPAMCDLFYLLLHWRWAGVPSFGRAHQEVFRRVFMSMHGTAAETASGEVRRYCAALGIDTGLMGPLLLRTLTQQALDRADRVRDSGGNPTDDNNLYGDLVATMVNAADPVPAWGHR